MEILYQEMHKIERIEARNKVSENLPGNRECKKNSKGLGNPSECSKKMDKKV